jgi:hypothetical protein
MLSLPQNCSEGAQATQSRIAEACRAVSRSVDSVTLLAVSKGQSSAAIDSAARAGIENFGENFLQESLPKIEALKGRELTWHFIGHFQTNKARKVVENFAWVHSIDRIDAAEALARHVINRAPLRVLIEVKLQDEPNKSGTTEGELAGLVASVRRLDTLDLRGLMAVPPPVETHEQARPFFRRLQQLAKDFGLSELSMGMTHDFGVAIEEGATIVRIGTALFGPRKR